MVAETCDTLLEKYAPMISAKARRELVRRKKIFLTSSVAWKQTALVKQGQFNKALELFFKHPSLFGYRAIGIGNRSERRCGSPFELAETKSLFACSVKT